MATRYIEVDSDKFETFLKSKGFVREHTEKGKEIVYARCNEFNSNIIVKIYTSITEGAEVARSIGSDAIRVVCIFDNGKRSFGIAKLPRVYRTGSQEKVEARTLERMREAYRVGNRWIREHKRKVKL